MNIFLAASVPLDKRDQKYRDTADNIAIRDAIKALVTTCLPMHTITFGGHPAITPLVAILLRGMDSRSRRRVTIFQSALFEQEFVRENDEFVDLRIVEAVGSRAASLQLMRQRMLSSRSFQAGVFIGGMEGVEDEYEVFESNHRAATSYPIASTGGAALELFRRHGGHESLLNELTYPTLFRRLFGADEVGGGAK